jgi:ABC-type enterochelin transport system ATPase subunit
MTDTEKKTELVNKLIRLRIEDCNNLIITYQDLLTQGRCNYEKKRYKRIIKNLEEDIRLLQLSP